MPSAKRTIDHETIRRWAEARGGHPAHVKGTENGDDPGILRIDFPGFTGEDTLEEISWDDWFRAFDEKRLAFLYQDDPKSRFNKLVSRTPEDEQEGTSGGDETERESADEERKGLSERRERKPKRWTRKTERVTINDASREELDALYGIGPRLAERIIDYRRKHGGIHGREDLIAIDGIDAATADLILSEVEID